MHITLQFLLHTHQLFTYKEPKLFLGWQGSHHFRGLLKQGIFVQNRTITIVRWPYLYGLRFKFVSKPDIRHSLFEEFISQINGQTIF